MSNEKQNENPDAMKNQLINEFTDITNIKIDKSKSVEARIEEYLNHVKNPCKILCGDTPVELLFAPPTAPTLNTLIAEYFISKKRNDL